MQSKKEAIEILKAMIENAINCNTPYKVTITHDLGQIIYDDKFSDTTLTYDYTKKNAQRSDDRDRDELSFLEETCANTRDTKEILKQMVSLLTNHTIRESFKVSQCNHYVGYINVAGKSLLVTQKEDMPRYKINVLFKFCPECGYKL